MSADDSLPPVVDLNQRLDDVERRLVLLEVRLSVNEGNTNINSREHHRLVTFYYSVADAIHTLWTQIVTLSGANNLTPPPEPKLDPKKDKEE